MTDGTVYDLELDVRGQACPMPLVGVGREIANIPIGGLLRMVATDPACKADIPAWARLTGNEIVSLDEADGEIVIVVRRVR